MIATVIPDKKSPLIFLFNDLILLQGLISWTCFNIKDKNILIKKI